MAQREQEETELTVPVVRPTTNCSLKLRGAFHSPKPNRTRPTSPDRSEAAEHTGASQAATANRCGGCRRKVGLMGFQCRCGGVFCAEHRHSDRHACGFDYKAAGREAIARANPVVRAPKIIKI